MLTDWSKTFPGLHIFGYRLTSLPTPNYNCIAWAAGDDKNWWEPDPFNYCYWPDGAPREYSVDAYISAYRTLGYQICDGPAREDGIEKIAIYLLHKMPQHAARQLDNGRWTSKLGEGDDIEHELDGLNGANYGIHQIYLAR
jgi:hypothetical protein